MQLNLAQILVTVPEGASEAQVAERRAKAEAALKRVQGGEDFTAVAREVSEDGNKARGGEIGLRPADRLPDIFVDFVRDLKSGQVAPQLLRSGAGFHVLKLVQRRDGSEAASLVTQTRARHVLLRPRPSCRPSWPPAACRNSSAPSSPAAPASRMWPAKTPRMAAPRRAAIWAGSRPAPSCPSSRRR